MYFFIWCALTVLVLNPILIPSHEISTMNHNKNCKQYVDTVQFMITKFSIPLIWMSVVVCQHFNTNLMCYWMLSVSLCSHFQWLLIIWETLYDSNESFNLIPTNPRIFLRCSNSSLTLIVFQDILMPNGTKVQQLMLKIHTQS